MLKAFIPKFLSSDDRKIVYDTFTMSLLADLLIPFQAYKDHEYDSHWAKRGIMGYKDGCIFRQTDRVEPGINNLIETCDFDDNGNLIPTAQAALAAASLMDTLIDSAVYSLLGVCLLSAKFPSAGDAFKRKMFHRVINGVDQADNDLDLKYVTELGQSLEADMELAAKLAAYYRARLEAEKEVGSE